LMHSVDRTYSSLHRLSQVGQIGTAASCGVVTEWLTCSLCWLPF
jgi:hypothetical protein